MFYFCRWYAKGCGQVYQWVKAPCQCLLLEPRHIAPVFRCGRDVRETARWLSALSGGKGNKLPPIVVGARGRFGRKFWIASGVNLGSLRA